MNFSEEISTDISNISDFRPNFPQSSYYVIPKDTVVVIKTVCYVAIVPFLLLLGLLLNSLCLAMFCSFKNKSSTVIILIGLTITDILILLNAAISSLMFYSRNYGKPFNTEQQLHSLPFFASFVQIIPGRTANILTLFISVERLMSVLLPLKIRQISTKKTAIFAVLASYILSVLLSAPFMFMYKVDKVYSNKTGQYVSFLHPTALGQNVELSDAIYISAETLARFIPVLGVMVSSTVTAVVVNVTARRRSMLAEVTSKSKVSRQELQVTKTLLIITFVYVFCQMPGTILRMIVFIDPDSTPYRFKNNIYDVAAIVCYVIFIINSVVNFLIYFKTSSKYKLHLKAMLSCHKTERRNTLTASTIRTTTSTLN